LKKNQISLFVKQYMHLSRFGEPSRTAATTSGEIRYKKNHGAKLRIMPVVNNLRNGVKISFQFQANYFGVSQLSFEANSRAI